MALIVGGGVVHGEDVDEDGRAGRDRVAPDLHILERLAQHQGRHAVHPLRLLQSTQIAPVSNPLSLQVIQQLADTSMPGGMGLELLRR